METWRHGHGSMDTETRDFKKSNRKRNPGWFVSPFIVCSSCIWKFVIRPFVDDEINGSYPFANLLNGLNGLAHLC